MEEVSNRQEVKSNKSTMVLAVVCAVLVVVAGVFAWLWWSERANPAMSAETTEEQAEAVSTETLTSNLYPELNLKHPSDWKAFTQQTISAEYRRDGLYDTVISLVKDSAMLELDIDLFTVRDGLSQCFTSKDVDFTEVANGIIKPPQGDSYSQTLVRTKQDDGSYVYKLASVKGKDTRFEDDVNSVEALPAGVKKDDVVICAGNGLSHTELLLDTSYTEQDLKDANAEIVARDPLAIVNVTLQFSGNFDESLAAEADKIVENILFK